MNTTQTDTGKKQETAKEILERHTNQSGRRLSAAQLDGVLAAMKELAEVVYKESYSDGKYAGKYPGDWPYFEWDKQSVMKELFPEDKTGHSES